MGRAETDDLLRINRVALFPFGHAFWEFRLNRIGVWSLLPDPANKLRSDPRSHHLDSFNPSDSVKPKGGGVARKGGGIARRGDIARTGDVPRTGDIAHDES